MLVYGETWEVIRKLRTYVTTCLWGDLEGNQVNHLSIIFGVYGILGALGAIKKFLERSESHQELGGSCTAQHGVQSAVAGFRSLPIVIFA